MTEMAREKEPCEETMAPATKGAAAEKNRAKL
jgi:hypothetical protein